MVQTVIAKRFANELKLPKLSETLIKGMLQKHPIDNEYFTYQAMLV